MKTIQYPILKDRFTIFRVLKQKLSVHMNERAERGFLVVIILSAHTDYFRDPLQMDFNISDGGQKYVYTHSSVCVKKLI